MIELIEQVIDSRLALTYTMNPARVLRYYPDEQTVDVQFVVTRPYTNDDNPTPIRLYTIPVIMPQGDDWVIGGQLKPNDIVMVVHSMFDIEDWMNGNQNKTYPAAGRDTQVIDSAYAVAGAFNYKNPTHDKRFVDKFHIVKGNNYFTLGSDGVTLSSDNGTSTIHLDNSGNLTINVAGTTTINSTKTTINNPVDIIGNTHITGTLAVTGGITSPTYSGLGGSGGSMNIQTITASTATIGGISYLGHKHTSSNAGGPSSTPIN